MKSWKELLYDWRDREEPYNIDQWTTMIEGVSESFAQFLHLPFQPFATYFFDINNSNPSVSFKLIAEYPTPHKPLVWLALGSIDVGETEEAQGKKRFLYPSIFLFLFYGGTRLLGENTDDSPFDAPNDYLFFDCLPDNDPQEYKWQEHEWEQGFPDEWKKINMDIPFSVLVVKLVSDDPMEREAACQSLNELTDSEKNGDLNQLIKEVKSLVQHEGLRPIITSDEFVARLFALDISLSEHFFKKQKLFKRSDADYMDQWQENHKDAPENLKKLTKQFFLDTQYRDLQDLYSTPSTFISTIFLGELGAELARAEPILRWMFREPNYCSTAAGMVFEMGSAGNLFFDDLRKYSNKDPHNVSDVVRQLGVMIRHSPEKIEKIFRNAQCPDPDEANFGIKVLGNIGPLVDPQCFPVMEKATRLLFDLSWKSFQSLYGANPISWKQRDQRKTAQKTFRTSTLALAQIDRSEVVACYFTELLDADLPDDPLLIPESNDRMFDEERYFSSRELVDETVISALYYFSAFPKIFVPRLAALLTDFADTNNEEYPHAPVLEALSAYARNDPNGPPFWMVKNEDEENDNNFGLFRNRHDPCFRNIPALLGSMIWENPEDKINSDWNELIVSALGNFGSTAEKELTLLEMLLEYDKERIGRYYKNIFKEYEGNSSIITAIQQIKDDLRCSG